MVKHYVVTLTTATPILLSTALGVSERDHQCGALWIQPRATNSAAAYIGTTATMTATDYGVRLEAPTGGVPPAPFNPGEFSGHGSWGSRSPTKLANFYLLGTTGDFLHILALWY